MSKKINGKKILCIALGILLVMAFTACGSSQEESKSSSGSSGSQQSSSEKSTSENGKVLVAYFSGSGNTKAAAKKIAKEAGADLYEIKAADPYTEDDLNWNDEDSRVNKEHEDKSLQNVKLSSTKVPGWDKYDTVFLGYPIWWGDAAWPINGFVKANDFGGKTVIPFCTSFSSGIGDSGKNLEKMAGSGNWKAGKRFAEDVSQSDVSAWVKGLDL